MTSSLSNLADDLAKRIHKDKCIHCKSRLEYVNVKDDLLLFNSSGCDKNHDKEINKDLAKRSESTYRFSDKDINKSVSCCKMLPL